jgi:DNA repair exonuclease SbcCD ATPase subunit
MRIRSVSVRNWACIEALDLTDLHDGLIILHGPNRTGKSSLVQAIRSCLFDHQHDSQDRAILAAVPWRSKTTPAVAIEFERTHERYRISKTYAKSRFGETRLEQQTDTGWTVLARGKDASKKTRELVGADKSAGGIFQMLWLDQQDFRLPDPKDLDTSLKKSLETVLGSLITGPDVDFKQRLDKACERWFTATGKDRKESPAVRLCADVAQARAVHEEIERQFHEAETALGELEEATARHPALQRDLQLAEEELARVQAEQQAFDVRKGQHHLALRNRDQAELLFAQAEQRFKEWNADTERLQSVEHFLADRDAAGQAADERLRLAEENATRTRSRCDEAERAHEEHRRQRATLDDRQQLFHVIQNRQALEQVLRQCEEHTRRLAELESTLAGPAPTEQDIEELRRNREEALKLHAQLDAAEFHVTLHAKKAVEAKAAIDDKAAKSVAVARGKDQRWKVRHHAEIAIGELATLHISRGQEDQVLKELARRCGELDRAYADRLKAAKATSIDALVERRHEREGILNEIKQHRDALARSSAAGLPNQQVELARLEREQEVILARRPKLVGWTPTLPEIDRLKAEFAASESQLATGMQTAKKAMLEANQALQQEQVSQRNLKISIAEQTAELRTLKSKVGQQDRAALAAAVQEAGTRLAEAQAKMDESALSDADQALEARSQAASHANRQRALRVRENEDLLLRLQTQLTGAEGLHQKRIQAEQTLADFERNFARESLQARAHRHLKELFEEIHQGQVRGAIDPVNDRVMRWAHQLGLADYRRLAFDSQLLPAGLESIHAPSGVSVALDQESLGTVEQLSLLIRLAVGGLLSRDEPTVALLDDPLAHADLAKHTRMLEILQSAARGEGESGGVGPLQIILLTCHAERFASMAGAQQIDLAAHIRRGG